MRTDGRDGYTLRPVQIALDYIKYPEGSALISFGGTRVLCSVSVDDKIPPFLKGSGTGWVTAEYAMLPRSTGNRTIREAVRGRISGRTQEIQRLIGRAMRAVVNLKELGERTFYLDCDVLQADGGTRTASISGAFVAMVLAVDKMLKENKIKGNPLKDFLAAASVGIVADDVLLDLDYSEDSRAEVDMNLVYTGSGRLVEIQATAEGEPFSENRFFEMLEIAKLGIQDIIEAQKQALKDRVDLNGMFPDLEWISR